MDDETARNFRGLTPGQQARAARAYAEAGGGQAGAEAGLGEINIEINRQGGWDSEVG